MAAPIMASGSSAQNGFWGSVLGGIGEGIGKVASDVAPVWAAGQLGLEPAGQISSPVNTSLGNIFGMPTAQSNFMDFEQGSIPDVKPNTVLAVGVVIVGLVVLFKIL
jgi:hypothetical protein